MPGITPHDPTPSTPSRAWSRSILQWTGLAVGPVGALVVFVLLPVDYRGADGQIVVFSTAGRATLGMMVWMGVWWLTEATDIATTALLPLILFPLLGCATIGDTAAPYAHPLIFLFMGGFLIAQSMQRWRLDRRIALTTLRIVGTRPANLVGGFMVATAAMSGFVSNTATTAMMMPIALSVIALLGERHEGSDAGGHEHLPPALMLGIAYAASIGGIATIIGTPPNVFFAGFVRDTIAEPYREEITFVRWLRIGVPVAAILLPAAWILLTRVLHPTGRERIPGAAELIRSQLRGLGPLGRGECMTLAVFLLTALAWITQPILTRLELPWAGVRPLAGLSDSGIAMSAALALFLLPINVRERQFVLDWQAAARLPWSILILFGGGLSLAAAVQANGVAEFIGSQAQRFAGLPPIVLVLIVTTAVVFLTELTSNIATTATLLPILAALAPALGLHPFVLIVPAAVSASCAFMMPVATPPNAIVFGTGQVTIPQMIRAGWCLNLIAIVVVTAVASLVTL